MFVGGGGEGDALMLSEPQSSKCYSDGDFYDIDLFSCSKWNKHHITFDF